MAFTLANWACISESMNQGQETVTPFGGSPTLLNAPNIFMFGSGSDSVATISASGYFNEMARNLCVGDWILGNGSDASFAVAVASITAGVVVVASLGLTTSIGTANIIDDAVTYAKLQDSVQAYTLLGNPGPLMDAEFAEVTLGNSLEFNAGELQVPLAVMRYSSVNVTLAEFLGMYAAPVQILPLTFGGFVNIIHSCVINMHYGSAPLVGGGAVGLQYGNTPHLADIPASETEAATDFTSASVGTIFRFSGSLSTGVAVSEAEDVSLYLSNDTAPFTGGTGATFTVDVWYSTVAVS